MSPLTRLRALVEFYIVRRWMVVFYTLTGRHDHDGPTLDYCSCGCPNAWCYPCGSDRKPRANALITAEVSEK